LVSRSAEPCEASNFERTVGVGVSLLLYALKCHDSHSVIILRGVACDGAFCIPTLIGNGRPLNTRFRRRQYGLSLGITYAWFISIKPYLRIVRFHWFLRQR